MVPDDGIGARMPVSIIMTLALLVFAGFAFSTGRARAYAASGGVLARLHSQPNYHGWFLTIWSVGPALLLLAVYGAFGDGLVNALASGQLQNHAPFASPERVGALIHAAREAAARGSPHLDSAAAAQAQTIADVDQALRWGVIAAAAGLAAGGFAFARTRVSRRFRARSHVESIIRGALIVCSGIVVLTTFSILASLALESLRFFERVSPLDFLFGRHWAPRADGQIGQSGAFGALPLFYGAFMVTLIAMAVAGPIGIFSAVYLSEYATPRARSLAKPMLEILAGVPTVVYGFFAFVTVGPAIRALAAGLGADVPAQSALAAGLVMGIMIIPLVSQLCDDVINAMPQSLRDGAYALGATKSETVQGVVLPAALPGVVGALLLAVSRALGETMIVVMAAGGVADMPINPLKPVASVTGEIVSRLTGDPSYALDSAKTLSAFALGLVLFIITLALNLAALRIVQKYRAKHE
jgi:phosphate transport system permease protein